MDKKNLRIVYMGTPDFAVASLKALVEGGYNVVGVITMPDKPAGRGHKLQFSAVKEYAVSLNLPLLQPEKLKDEKFIEALKAWNADIQIVVAFRMLPEVVWNMPKLGTFNLHASLLPQYRGAAPINWAVMNGEKETGATTFFLTHDIDTGKIIRQEKIAIADDENVGSVHDRLMNMGASLVTSTVDYILEGEVESIDQKEFYNNENELKAAPKIFKETCKINWNDDSIKIYNQIRGLSPYPAAWSEIKDEENNVLSVKIFESKIESSGKPSDKNPGDIITDGKSFINVVTSDGIISISSLQLSGKKRMDSKSLLNGFKINDNFRFE
ncbi:MAG: methionyl-tRNA formyltransferase [Bacteroidales bacterium]|nr:methionyl-tRNA formyltransferase [Bacteroidales bacterium]